MGPVEAGLMLAAKQRQERLDVRPLLKPFASKSSVITPIDLAHSPYGPPVPVFEERVKWRAQEKNIIEIVAGLYGVSACDVIAHRREHRFFIPRMTAVYLCNKLTTHSLVRIGRAMGGRDHTTMIHSIRKVARIIDAGEEKHLRLIARIHEAEQAIRDRYAVAGDL